ncbi:MAG: ATP-binding protein [Rhizobacter sp.]
MGTRSKPVQPLDEIRAAFGRLNSLLNSAIAAFNAEHGGPVTDRLRGVVISPDQCHALLQREPVSPAFAIHPGLSTPLWPSEDGTWAQRLSSTFSLEAFDLDVLLLALASEFDLRYERLFGYLQDDVTRKRPTVDLALSLLCIDDAARLEARGCFAADAPLLRHGLLHLAADSSFSPPSLLAHVLSPDEQLVRFLLGARGLHSELAGCCTGERVSEQKPRTGVADLLVPAEARRHLERLATAISAKTSMPPVWLHTCADSGTAEVARAVANAAGTSLLLLDATRVLPRDAERTLHLAQREAWLRADILCIEHAQTWLDEPFAASRLATALRSATCPTLLGAVRGMPAELLGIALPLIIPAPNSVQREQCWRSALARHDASVSDTEAGALAARFRLAPSQIAAAVDDACLRSIGKPNCEEMQAAARRQSGDALATVADKVDAKATWDDIVLSADAVAQLHELCSRVEQHDRVFNDWGFERKLSRGRGTAALFSGASGTGKTMAAEVIANALGLDLYRIDLARVINKYIGETEKNLDLVFAAAQSANAILFFDEADALFGKRSEVKDAHDRYANIEVSYLLQKMEEYDGLSILASNLADNLDEAFTRRLAFAIHFPLPDEAARFEIWQRAWPQAAQVAKGLDRAALARELTLAGGSIKNIALGAAFSAAANGGVIDESHVAHAVQREYEKSGRASTVPPRFATPHRAPGLNS